MITLHFHFSKFCGAKNADEGQQIGINRNQMFIIDDNVCVCWPTKSKALYWTEDSEILYYAKYHETERIRWPVIFEDQTWKGIWNYNSSTIRNLWLLMVKLKALETSSPLQAHQEPTSISVVHTYF